MFKNRLTIIFYKLWLINGPLIPFIINNKRARLYKKYPGVLGGGVLEWKELINQREDKEVENMVLEKEWKQKVVETY